MRASPGAWEPGGDRAVVLDPVPEGRGSPTGNFSTAFGSFQNKRIPRPAPSTGLPPIPESELLQAGQGRRRELPAAPGEVWDPLVTRHLGSRVGASVVQTAALEETTGSKLQEVSTKRNSRSLRVLSLDQLDHAGSHHGPHSNGCRWVNEPRVQQENHFLSNVVASSARPVWGSTLLRGFFPNERASLGGGGSPRV